MIEFKDISPEILESKLAWLDTKQKGKWYQSTEMTPQDRKNKLKHQLYSEDYKILKAQMLIAILCLWTVIEKVIKKYVF